MAAKKEDGEKATTRVTAAQVNAKVEALDSRIDNLEEGVGTIVEMLTEQRAARVLSEAKAQITAENAEVESRSQRPVPAAAPVGEREGDVIVRNLHDRAGVRVRIGKQTDPFRINLAPRGQKGDTTAVPASLRGDMGYRNNLGVAFEEISDQEAMALAGRKRGGRGRDPEYLKARQAQTVRDEDRTVATMRDQTPEDRLTRVGPRYVDLPGSHNPSNELLTSDLTRADAEADPEYHEFLRYKANQRAARAGGDIERRPAPEVSEANRSRIQRAAASGDPEAAAMARYLDKLEKKGVLPAGEIDKPVVLERTTISVQPNVY